MAAGRPADLHHRDRPDHAQHPGAGAAESRGRARDRCGNRPARGVALSDRPCERATAGRAAVGSLRPPAGCARRPRAHRDHELGRARGRQYHEPRRRAHHAGGRRGKRPRGRARHRARPVHARARRRNARPDRHRDGHRADLRPADRRDSRDRLRLALDLPVRGHGSICGAGMGGRRRNTATLPRRRRRPSWPKSRPWRAARPFMATCCAAPSPRARSSPSWAAGLMRW